MKTISNFLIISFALMAQSIFPAEIETAMLDATFLSVTPVSWSVPADGGTKTIYVSCDADWTVSSNTDWATLSVTSGSGIGQFIITVAKNEVNSVRTATVTVVSGELSKTVGITQAAGSGTVSPTYTLTVSPDNLTFTAEGGTAGLSISSNTTWTVASNAEWASVETPSGSNNANVNISCAANESFDFRQATITVAGGGLTKTINISQAGVAQPVFTLTVSPRSLNFDWEGEPQIVTVESNTSWIVSSPVEWATVSVDASEGNASFFISCRKNETDEDRRTTITVSGGGLTQSVYITQRAEPVIGTGDDGLLASITLTDGVELSPAFDPDILDYSVSVPNNITSLSVEAVPQLLSTIVTVSGNNDLRMGRDLILITTVATDGTVRNYVIKVHRSLPDNYQKENGFNTWAAGERLYIKAEEPSTLTIFSPSGTVISRLNYPKGETSVPLSKGLYILKTGNGETKRVVSK
jgi:hypothetical protein